MKAKEYEHVIYSSLYEMMLFEKKLFDKEVLCREHNFEIESSCIRKQLESVRECIDYMRHELIEADMPVPWSVENAIKRGLIGEYKIDVKNYEEK